MELVTFSIGRRGKIVLPDDASDKDIYNAMYLDATMPQGNGGRTPKKENDDD